MKKKFQAFTLIEMVVVLFIISLLLLLVVPNLAKQKTRAENQTTAALVTTIQTQIELAKDDPAEKAETLTTLADLAKADIISQKQCKQAERAKITFDGENVSWPGDLAKKSN